MLTRNPVLKALSGVQVPAMRNVLAEAGSCGTANAPMDAAPTASARQLYAPTEATDAQAAETRNASAATGSCGTAHAPTDAQAMASATLPHAVLRLKCVTARIIIATVRPMKAFW